MSEPWAEQLLRLVRAVLDAPASPRLRPKEVSSAHWSMILASARRHRLSGLLFEAVRTHELVTALPRRGWASLYSDYYTQMARNLVLFDHAEAFLAEAQSHRAPALFLKGAAFAGWLYGNPALRPMTDLDILVRRQDLDTLVQSARKLGYEWCKKTDHAVALRHRGSSTYLELHTSLTSSPGYLGPITESLLARSIPASFWPESARTLAPEDHLLHLCLHGSFQHGLRQPAINACDVYLLSRLPDLNWERFLNIASTRRIAPLVYGGLALCQRIVPNDSLRRALETLAPRVKTRQRRRLDALDVSRLLSASPESTNGPPWCRILMTPGVKDSWSLIWETLRPRETADRPHVLSPVRRGLELVYRHGLSRWTKGSSPRAPA